MNEKGEGDLYECSINNTFSCEKIGNKNIYGYFKVEDLDYFDKVQYIKCDGEKCQKMNVPTTNQTTDQCSNIGELVIVSKEVKICVSYNTQLSFTNRNYYLMLNSFETDPVLKVYSTSKKTVISIKDNSIAPADLKSGIYFFSF